MGILRNPFKKPVDEDRIRYSRDLACAEVGSPQQAPEQDFMEMQKKAGFTISDEHVITIIAENTELQDLMFPLSPMNSLIKLSPRQADLKRIRWENYIAMKKLTMKPEVYEENGMITLEGVRYFGHDRITGAEEGWIGHITTENVRVIKSQEMRGNQK